MKTFGSKELEPYRDAIVTKKLASLAYYRFCLGWEAYLGAVDSAFSKSLNSIFAE
jgi:glutamate dehydrogenase